MRPREFEGTFHKYFTVGVVEFYLDLGFIRSSFCCLILACCYERTLYMEGLHYFLCDVCGIGKPLTL